MDDDFGTAQALASLFDLAREINRFSDEGYSVGQGQELLMELAGLLGLTLKEPEELVLSAEQFEELRASMLKQFREFEEWQTAQGVLLKGQELNTEEFINLVISHRDQMRRAEKWEAADQVRKLLEEFGIELRDTQNRTIWRSKR